MLPQAGPELEGTDEEGEAAPSDMGQQPDSTWPEAAELARRDVGEKRDGVIDQIPRAKNNETGRNKKANRAPDEATAVIPGFESRSRAGAYRHFGSSQSVRRREDSTPIELASG